MTNGLCDLMHATGNIKCTPNVVLSAIFGVLQKKVTADFLNQQECQQQPILDVTMISAGLTSPYISLFSSQMGPARSLAQLSMVQVMKANCLGKSWALASGVFSLSALRWSSRA